MSKTKKIFLTLFAGLVSLIACAIGVQASTSSELSEIYQFNMSNSYGYDYTAPFAVATDEAGVLCKYT